MYDKMTAGPASSRAATPAAGKRRVRTLWRWEVRRCVTPASAAAAAGVPVSTKTPAPMMPPIPSSTRSKAPRTCGTRGHSGAFPADGGRALRQGRAFFMPPGSAARATASSTFFRRTALARKRSAYASNAARRGPMPARAAAAAAAALCFSACQRKEAQQLRRARRSGWPGAPHPREGHLVHVSRAPAGGAHPP